jgi:hypothetical protein
MKDFQGSRQSGVVSGNTGTAPPVYRPQPGASQLKQVAPPVYRPKPIAQFSQQGAPPVYVPRSATSQLRPDIKVTFPANSGNVFSNRYPRQVVSSRGASGAGVPPLTRGLAAPSARPTVAMRPDPPMTNTGCLQPMLRRAATATSRSRTSWASPGYRRYSAAGSGGGGQPPRKNLSKELTGHYAQVPSPFVSLLEWIYAAKRKFYTPTNFNLPGTGIYGQVLHRADSRPPHALVEGFTPRGSNLDVRAYVLRNVASRYVPTAATQYAAIAFARLRFQFDPNGPDTYFVYEATRVRQGVVISDYLWASNPFPEQEEVAVLGGIPRRNIRRFREVRRDGTIGEWQDFPGYEPYDYETGEGLGP